TPEELKHELMTDEVLEVFCEHPETAMGAIEKLPQVKEAALFGRGLHVVVDNAATGVAAIRQTLAERGFRLETAEKITPSLEDVFVALIEARDRAEQPQQEVRA
ncbi:MAG: ATP-binding protein DrrA1-3 family domain-containing protein, partial [Thermoguttaceae bacterium]